jgi:histidinol-phosphate phosphatase family protein
MKPAFCKENNWSLFLDRDGILNNRLVDDYVKTPEEFIWNPGVLEFLKICSEHFPNIIVITNQQGIGKGLMSEHQLDLIHQKMLHEARESGGRIDKVYYCGHLENSGSFYRKPAVGMGLQAKKDLPGINFSKSLMVGDTLTDMLFGKRLKMTTILVSPQASIARQHPGFVDWWFEDMQGLLDFVKNQCLDT